MRAQAPEEGGPVLYREEELGHTATCRRRRSCPAKRVREGELGAVKHSFLLESSCGGASPASAVRVSAEPGSG